jgi:hypothetical protein
MPWKNRDILHLLVASSQEPYQTDELLEIVVIQLTYQARNHVAIEKNVGK